MRKVRAMMAAFALAIPGVAIPGVAIAAGTIAMHRDPGCGCCEAWARQVKAAFGRDVQAIDDARRTTQARVPADLRSCHTAIIDGMIFEGHVPTADMQRVLKLRPAGVAGLTVAGMPMGSPGMEVPGQAAQAYDVIAFGPGGRRVFAHHG